MSNNSTRAWICRLGLGFAGISLWMMCLDADPIAYAQDPTPTPDPIVLELQNQAQALSQRVDSLAEDTEELNQELDLLRQLQGIVIGIGIVSVGVGIAAPVLFRRAADTLKQKADAEIEKRFKDLQTKLDSLENQWNKNTQQHIEDVQRAGNDKIDALQKQIEQRILDLQKSDPLFAKLHIPAQNFDSEAHTLEDQGFRNFNRYESLSELADDASGQVPAGVVIYRATSPEDVIALEHFINERQPDRRRTAFILYFPKQIEGAQAVVNRISQHYPYISMGNTIVRLLSDIFNMARATYAARKASVL